MRRSTWCHFHIYQNVSLCMHNRLQKNVKLCLVSQLFDNSIFYVYTQVQSLNLGNREVWLSSRRGQGTPQKPFAHP